MTDYRTLREFEERLESVERIVSTHDKILSKILEKDPKLLDEIKQDLEKQEENEQ